MCVIYGCLQPRELRFIDLIMYLLSNSDMSIGLGDRLFMGEGETLREWRAGLGERDRLELTDEETLDLRDAAVSLRMSEGTQPSLPSTTT